MIVLKRKRSRVSSISTAVYVSSSLRIEEGVQEKVIRAVMW